MIVGCHVGGAMLALGKIGRTMDGLWSVWLLCVLFGRDA